MNKYLKNIIKPFYNKLKSNINKSLYSEIELMKQEIARIGAVNFELQKKFDFIFDNKYGEWLYRNQNERMDASLDFFHPVRRNFHIDRYKFALNYTENKIVGDIACGTGYGSKILAVEGNANKVYSIDISEEAIDYAKNMHGHSNIEFICSSANKTRLASNTLDILVSFETLEHIQDEVSLINEFYRILKPKGILIISTPNEWPLEIAIHHHKVYDLFEFKKVLSKKFVIVDVYNQNSGHNWEYNRGQKRGILKTIDTNYKLAECYIAVCFKNI
jgi:2-polyprenyl-3-methyl-5-hydroxy-6-metoxy-1,4-benzoquinol methylase